MEFRFFIVNLGHRTFHKIAKTLLFIFYPQYKVSFQSKTYRSPLFRNFKALDAAEFRQVVLYYERNEKAILRLEFAEYFEMLVAYSNALFEIGEYQKHIVIANIVIETSIVENVTHVNNQEIFQFMLFRKAASHYNLMEYQKAIHVLQELLKIDPNNILNAQFLERCLRDDQPQIVRNTRATAIFLFLMAALTISVEVLIVRNFYPDLISLIESSRNTMFIMGALALICGMLWHRWICHHQVQVFINKIKKHKKITH